MSSSGRLTLPYAQVGQFAGADPTGATSSLSAVQAAYSALGGDTGAGGLILLDPGTWVLDNGVSGFVNNNPRIGLVGLDSAVTTIKPSAGFAGIEYTAANPSFDATGVVSPGYSAKTQGLTFDGSQAGAGCVGFLLADHIGDKVDDLVIQHFNGAGSEGWRVSSLVANGTANSGWVERLRGTQIEIVDCTTCLRFHGKNLTTPTSFNYGELDGIHLTLNSGQTGIKYDNKFVVTSQKLHLTYNVTLGASAATILSVGADDLFGQLTGVDWTVGGENDGAGTAPVNLVVGTGSKFHAVGSAEMTGSTNTVSFGAGSTVKIAGYININGVYNNTAGVAFVTYDNTATSQILVQGVANVSELKITSNTTGAGSAALGANSPAATLTAPHTWLEMVSADGSTVYVPAWK